MAHTFGVSARLPVTNTVTTANPAILPITCPIGTTVLWVGIVVSGTTARTGGSPTYNNIPMVQAGSKRNAGGTPEEHVEQWYLINPPTGFSIDISVPNANARSMTLSAATAAAQSGYVSALDTQSGAAGSSTNPTANINIAEVGEIVFAICGDGAQAWNPSGRSGIQIHDWDTGSRGHASQYILPSSTGTQATNWTFGTSEDWAISSVAFYETPIITSRIGGWDNEAVVAEFDYENATMKVLKLRAINSTELNMLIKMIRTSDLASWQSQFPGGAVEIQIPNTPGIIIVNLGHGKWGGIEVHSGYPV